MNNFLQKNMTLIIAVVVFGAALYAYNAFFKPQDAATAADLSAQQVGNDVLSLYQSLQQVKLDQTLFSSPLYSNLSDFSTSLPQQGVGRPNPFDTIGRD